jgi:ADP-ribose pyrophosphatase YjhB (NUDIX family)
MDRTALETEGQWFEPDKLAELRRLLPIAYVDVVPVRTDVDGSVTQVGLLLRASGDGRIVRSIIRGRVLIHETLREAVVRHVDKDLGYMAMPRIPAGITPFTVAEYFPTPGQSLVHDPRQHAISLCYLVPMDGEATPQDDALEFTWFDVAEVLDGTVLDELEDGADVVVRRALTHAGLC